MGIVKNNHEEFLNSINFNGIFDPYTMKTWHHDFNLEEVPKIPIFELVEKPSIKITSMKDFLNENDFKSNLVSKAMQNFDEKNSENSGKNLIFLDDFKNSIITENNKNNNIDNLKKFVTTNLINKVNFYSI